MLQTLTPPVDGERKASARFGLALNHMAKRPSLSFSAKNKVPAHLSYRVHVYYIYRTVMASLPQGYCSRPIQPLCLQEEVWHNGKIRSR